MGGMVAEHIKDKRLQELQTLLSDQALKFNQSSLGKTIPVLFDRKGQKTGQLLGKTPYMQSIYVEAPNRLFGEILNVKINKATQNGLSGTIVTTEEDSTTLSPNKERAAA